MKLKRNNVPIKVIGMIVAGIVTASCLLFVGNGAMRLWGLKRLESRGATRAETIKFFNPSADPNSISYASVKYPPDHVEKLFKKQWDRMDEFEWSDGFNFAPWRVFVSYKDDRVSEIVRTGL